MYRLFGLQSNNTYITLLHIIIVIQAHELNSLQYLSRVEILCIEIFNRTIILLYLSFFLHNVDWVRNNK